LRSADFAILQNRQINAVILREAKPTEESPEILASRIVKFTKKRIYRFFSLKRQGILRAFALRMTAVTENGKQKAENGICENLPFLEFLAFTQIVSQQKQI